MQRLRINARGGSATCVRAAARASTSDLATSTWANVRFRQRQWHMFAGRDHIKLACKQHDVDRDMTAVGDATGIIAFGAPVEIGTLRSDEIRLNGYWLTS